MGSRSQCVLQRPPAVSIPTSDTILEDSNNNNNNNNTSTTPLSELSDFDSLFDQPLGDEDEETPASPMGPLSTNRPKSLVPALLTAPPIPGLFFSSSLRLPEGVANLIMDYCIDTYFKKPRINQVMLFGRLNPSDNSSSGLPPLLLQLLDRLHVLLHPLLPLSTHDLLFPRVPTQARQAILNLYQPGEGISPHVDLLNRYGDGIIGVSLGSGCTMRFAKLDLGKTSPKEMWDMYLPEGSIIVLSGPARYEWTHGIDGRKEDYVACDPATEDFPGTWVSRGVRLSVTFRWLLPGADVVGEEAGSQPQREDFSGSDELPPPPPPPPQGYT